MKGITEDIRAGVFSRIYLLVGTESYLRNQYRDKLLSALGVREEDMNYARFEGKGISEKEIISLAETLPFLAERRVILVEDSGFFKNKTEELADYLQEIPEYLVLIFSEEEADKRGRMYKAANEKGRVAEFGEQSSDTLAKWVVSLLGKVGKKITRADLEYFLSLAGTDMFRVRNETEKLIAYCGDREAVRREDIDAIASPQIENRIFDMVRAVAGHRKKEAFDLYADLLALKEPPLRILYLLAREFNNLRRLRDLRAESVSQPEMAKIVGIPPFAVRKSLELLRSYEDCNLDRLVEAFVQAETDVKTGKLDERLAVELMLLSAYHWGR